MAFNATQTLKATLPTVATTGSDVVYNLRGQSMTGSERVDTSSTPTAGNVLRISHRKEKILGQPADAHMVQIVRDEKDANGVAHQASVTLSIKYPNSGVISTAELDIMYMNLLNFLAQSGATTLLLRGES